MIIGILKIDLHLPGATSLKQKRMVLKSMKDRVRRTFNVSIAETDQHDKWQVARMGIAAIGMDKGTVNSLLDKVVNFLSTLHDAELCDYEIEII